MDAEACKKVFNEHKDFLFCHVRKRYTLGVQDQDELVQEAFFRLFQKEIPETSAAVRGYLVLTIRNLYIDNYRKRQSHAQYESDYGVLEETQFDSPEADLVRAMEINLVIGVLNKISGETGVRELKMQYMEGLSLKEISEITGESVGTIGSKISRAKKLMKGHIEEI